jgi:putative ABC transport system permease protein
MGTLALGRLIETLLFDTAPHDPAVLAATVAAVGLLVVGACLAPARRASRVDPATVLRAE